MLAFPSRHGDNFLPVPDQGAVFEIHDINSGHSEERTLTPGEYAEILEKNGLFHGYEKDIAENIFRKLKSGLKQPRLMQVVNVTPDSFFPGSRIDRKAISRLDQILDQEPDIIDVGGESTRPESPATPQEVEVMRVQPVVEYISGSSSIPVSIDSRHPATIQKLLKYRVNVINDISGFSDPAMVRIATDNDLECVVMHMRGDPGTMQNDTHYSDVVTEVAGFLSGRANDLVGAGINPSRIILDPGIGFGKDYSGNLQLLRNAHCFNLGFRTLIGHSRKRFIGDLTGRNVEDRLPGTIATSLYLLREKVDILRVHDLIENRDALRMFAALTG